LDHIFGRANTLDRGDLAGNANTVGRARVADNVGYGLAPCAQLVIAKLEVLMRFGLILALVAAMLWSPLPAANADIRIAQTGSLIGNYAVSGTNPNGTKYSGVAVISLVSGNQYRFDWTVNNQHFSGTGVLNGSTISVDWGQAAPVIYQVSASGLNGTWDNGHATEVLTPQ
jgi:hypothetical protein